MKLILFCIFPLNKFNITKDSLQYVCKWSDDFFFVEEEIVMVISGCCITKTDSARWLARANGSKSSKSSKSPKESVTFPW